MARQLPEFDLRYSYRRTLEASAVAALALVILMMMVFKKFEMDVQVSGLDAPPIKVEDIPITRTIRQVEVPRKPTIPVEAPEVDATDDIDIPTFDFDSPIIAPPPQAPPEELEVVPIHIVEQLPEIVGGTNAIADYIRRNNLYPRVAAETRVSGTVLLRFVVDVNGNPINITVDDERPANMGFGDVAIRAMRVQKFTPAMMQDRVVAVEMTQSIVFRIE